ncbi:MAG: cell division protein ZipA C-terminal FtsZ-binding domain-containing protein [Methylotenera sp.]|nr:cell division protein ZipA C-terminal FtsZ-binding domain-containing protein [Methylotenera sp.]
MSDLQIILIILGAFIIAGVVIYNWLQERNLRNQVINEFIVPQKDVLAEDFYIDTDAFVEKELAEVPQKFKQSIFEESNQAATQPQVIEETASLKAESNQQTADVLEKSINHEEKSTHLADQYLNETLSASNESESFTARPSVEVVKPDLHTMPETLSLPDAVHAQIDLTAMLFANQKMSHQALCNMADSIDEIRLPMMIFGLDSLGKWHLVQSNQVEKSSVNPNEMQYKQAACSLQLADRGGPIAKNILNKFQYAVENMGLELNAHVEWQGSGDVLQRAIELDQFCIEVDQLINVHVAQGETPIHGTKFRGLAEANGMALNEDGRFHFYANNDSSAQKLPLFYALEANNQALTAENLRNNVLKAVTFQLEIPKVPNCEQAFNQMINVAQKLSGSLNAHLVDDNQKPLGDLQIEKIRQQLKIIHATMVARGVMPGSLASMRLFN